MKRVYLAGPPFAEEYRRRATALFEAAGCGQVDPMRRDFRGGTEGREREIVEGDLADIDSCDAVLADFSRPDEGTAMEAWYAHGKGIPVVAYTGGQWAHPWTVYVSASVHGDLDDAVGAVRQFLRSPGKRANSLLGETIREVSWRTEHILATCLSPVQHPLVPEVEKIRARRLHRHVVRSGMGLEGVIMIWVADRVTENCQLPMIEVI